MWVKVLSKHQPAFIAVLSFNLCILFYYICVYGIVQILYYSSLGYGDIESFCFYFVSYWYLSVLQSTGLTLTFGSNSLLSVFPVVCSPCLIFRGAWSTVIDSDSSWFWVFVFILFWRVFFNLCLIPIDMKCIICFQDSVLIKVKKTDDSIRSPSGVRRGPGRDHRPTFTQQ